MSSKEKMEKLNKSFMVLSEEGKQYALAVVDALAYATELVKEPQPPNEAKKDKTA